jgi:hypothetical protein
MRRSFAQSAALAVMLFAHAAVGQVRSTIVGPGVTRYPIAVSPLKGLTQGAGDRFVAVLARDLELSGIFRVIPSDTYIEQAATSGVTAETINFDNWSVIGALAIVKGTAERQGNDLTIEARLFDVGQRRQLAGRRFRGTVGDEHRMANRFADEILATFTGERGWSFQGRLRHGRRRRRGASGYRRQHAQPIALVGAWGARAGADVVSQRQPRSLLGSNAARRLEQTVVPARLESRRTLVS